MEKTPDYDSSNGRTLYSRDDAAFQEKGEPASTVFCIFFMALAIVWTLRTGFHRRRHVPYKLYIDNIAPRTVCSTRE